MLPNYLANIKSSGIYRFVFDKSEMPGQEAETLRLVIGYSEKGPFNTPVYVETEDDFKKIYGGISKKMERYGMWFHRMAIQALKAGPILAFNLKNFEDAPVTGKNINKVEYTTFNPSGSIFHMDVIEGTVMENLKMAIKDLYNTDRFWTLEPEQLEDYVNDHNNVQTPKGYITIATTDSKDTSVTVFMRGYEPKGYDVPFMEWYSSVLNGEELPSYLDGHERDLVSQYWAEMFIFNGEFTPEIAASDKLAKFFDVNGDEVTLKPYIVNAFGEKIDTLDALASNDASNFVRKYAGILLPDFRNANNTVISLDAQVNADNYIHKLMMRFNQDMLYSIELPDDNGEGGSDFQLSDLDTTGWNNGPDQNGNMMSIMGVEPIVFVANFDGENWNYDEGTHAGEAADFYKYNELIPSETSGFTMKFTDEDNRFGKTGIREGDSLFIGDTLAHVVKINNNNAARCEFMHDSDICSPGTAVNAKYRKTGNGIVVSGELEHDEVHLIDGNPTDRFGVAIKFGDSVDEENTTFEINGFDCGSIKTEMDTNPADWERAIYLYPAVLTNGQLSIAGQTGDTIQVKINYPDGYNEVIEFAYMETDDMTINNLGIRSNMYEVQFDKENLSGDIYKCVGSITATSTNVKPLYLKGYVYGNPKPESTKQIKKWEWQQYMLKALTNYKGLRVALTSRVDLEYRYLVDTFEGFVEPECKAILSTICKDKDNVFGILNFPAIKNFSKCDYTSFRNEKNEFDTKYIAMGGNPLKPMSMMFSLPSQENGASWCGFFTALKVRDINTGVKEDIPSAALVSNNFMQKYTKYLPYTIIAGTNRGVVRETGLLGPDFNFSREDLDNLEPFGVNCMVYVDRKGTCINSNQTAKQNPVTTLSKISTRELVIFLQDEIEKLLLDYHWDFNTPNLQQRIKDRADVILETAKNNDGVYTYRNQCDKYNNTDDVVNNEMFVLSTSIEPGMGAGKMVQELYIYRKGGMSSAIISDTGA